MSHNKDTINIGLLYESSVNSNGLYGDTIFYHGSKVTDIKSFKCDRGCELGSGSYWTPERERAGRYGKYVYEARLVIKNPISHSFKHPDGIDSLDSIIPKELVYNEEINQYCRKKGYDSIIKYSGYMRKYTINEVCMFYPDNIKLIGMNEYIEEEEELEEDEPHYYNTSNIDSSDGLI